MDNDDNNDDDDIVVPDIISSVVLRQAYPAMKKHMELFGNPNIPLGSTDGRRCKTIRRLQFEGKLKPEEVTLLEDIGFRFNSFEDVYNEADFDEILSKLIAYENEHKNNYQIPKKYAPDPELGAWVTMARRLGPNKVESKRRDILNSIGFSWISQRKCGSTFMTNYRALRKRLDDGENMKSITTADETIVKWLISVRKAYETGNLGETRVEYLDNLPGLNWRTVELPTRQ